MNFTEAAFVAPPANLMTKGQDDKYLHPLLTNPSGGAPSLRPAVGFFKPPARGCTDHPSSGVGAEKSLANPKARLFKPKPNHMKLPTY